MRHKLNLRLMALPLLALAALPFAPLHAEPGLPDTTVVSHVLDQHPTVVAAWARVDAARADARARGMGTHELTFSGSYTRRTVDREGEFDEFDTQLTRAFRLPGKAALDREIGQLGIEEAENMAEDAKHQVALVLLGHWFDWLGASAEARVDTQAVTNFERALAAVQRRVELRDAAPLDADQTQAALGAARLAAEQSTGRASMARARLQAQLPTLVLPDTAEALPVPSLPAQGLDQLHDLVLSNSHEIAAADARAQRMGTLAERSRQDRIADPSLGIRLFSERNGQERGAGLVFSMPLGGGHRAALADQAAADASAALSEAQRARFDVREVAEADVAEASYRQSAWHRAREGLDAQMAALLKLRRGYQLGEIDLGDLLLAERMVHDALRGEAAARTEALRSFARLRIDSHQLWLTD